MLRAILLDIDGTLIDSNNAHAQSWVEALEAHGLDVPFSSVRPLIGMGSDRILPKVAGLADDSIHGRAIAATRKRIFKEKYLPNLEPFPEVRELLLRMKDEGLKIIVATSSGGDQLEELLKQAHIDDLVKSAATSDSVDSSKPAPDIVIAALATEDLAPSEALMIGDTPYDEEAATRAGVEFVGFQCGGWTINDFSSSATVYKDAADLLKGFNESPLATPNQRPTMIEMAVTR